MKLNAILSAAAFVAVGVFSAQGAPIMADYDLGSSDSSLSEDPFGVLGPFNAIRLEFNNIVFKVSGANPFNLTGFEVYRLENVVTPPSKITTVDIPSATHIGTTGPCSGFTAPTAGNPVSVGIITCAFTTLNVPLDGTPLYVMPRQGSSGVIARDVTTLPSGVTIGGADVSTTSDTPEPSTAACVALGGGAVLLARRRRR